ncbi:hypothetical protein phiAS5_ORF0125 [Aeromonas phage phiAS5]|uniref:Uncharacterized protein n=1 Tax=Aeromonas phage phiAS5 TaxID=879630 RepID=E1A2M2_9CAUD|nr:Ndd-like nucleoid disruption protein [Aeromonas phage phiAS5]ADM79968.1 hypothetical protein phiAS5_ORF0125 [Aeromonas phage phiAS5]
MKLNTNLLMGNALYIGTLFPNKTGILEFTPGQIARVPVNHDLTTPGFYLIATFPTNDARLRDIVSVNHVGIQKRKTGFKEVLRRLNNPRTEQNKALGDYLCKRSTEIFTDASIVKAWREVEAKHQVFFVSYAQMRDLLGIEEYSAKNNGIAMITELRTKYDFIGRLKS